MHNSRLNKLNKKSCVICYKILMKLTEIHVCIVRMHKRTVCYIFILSLTIRMYLNLFHTFNITSSIMCYLGPFSMRHKFLYLLPSHTFPLACHLLHLVATSHTLPLYPCFLTCFCIHLEDEDDNIPFKCWNHLLSDMASHPEDEYPQFHCCVNLKTHRFHLGSLTCLQC
jgi:hypothetical protein